MRADVILVIAQFAAMVGAYLMGRTAMSLKWNRFMLGAWEYLIDVSVERMVTIADYDEAFSFKRSPSGKSTAGKLTQWVTYLKARAHFRRQMRAIEEASRGRH